MTIRNVNNSPQPTLLTDFSLELQGDFPISHFFSGSHHSRFAAKKLFEKLYCPLQRQFHSILLSSDNCNSQNNCISFTYCLKNYMRNKQNRQANESSASVAFNSVESNSYSSK
jgi:hypothetical protein